MAYLVDVTHQPTPDLNPLCSENRMRLGLEIVSIVRANLPAHKPLFLRISATDWHPAGETNEAGEYISWGIEQSKVYVSEAIKRGIDLLDVSSGGNDTNQKITIGPGYQVSYVMLLFALIFSRDADKVFRDRSLSPRN